VIQAYFEDKGLVRQQLDSFNEFINSTMQEIVDDHPALELRPESQHIPGQNAALSTKYKISFDQIFISRCVHTEGDGQVENLFPGDARLRNLTYCAPLFIDVCEQKIVTNEYGEESVIHEERRGKILLGKVPIMLKTQYCMLVQYNSQNDLCALNECTYDQGGYFIINGSEKVLIAQ